MNPQVVWACGRNGTFTVTTDGGQTWNASVVPGAETLQFRDVQAFSASVAYLMSIGANPTDFQQHAARVAGVKAPLHRVALAWQLKAGGTPG